MKKTEQATRGTGKQEATQWKDGQSNRSPPGGHERRLVRGPRAQEQDGHPRHRRIDDTPARRSEVLLKAESPGQAEGIRQRFHQARDWVGKTAQRAEADGAGACGSRAGVPRWGVDDPERSERGRQRGAPPRDALLGRTRRRVGGRRSMRRPSDTAVARGQKRRPHAVKKTEQATRGTGKQEATQWKDGQSNRSPPGGHERRQVQAGAGGRGAIWPRSWPQAAATSRPLLQRTVTFMCAAARMPANALMRSASGAARPAR